MFLKIQRGQKIKPDHAVNGASDIVMPLLLLPFGKLILDVF
jgi:hypothetical protein